MRLALLNVSKEYDGYVDGVWLQGCTACTLDEATQRAVATEKKNTGGEYGKPLTIAVVEDVFGIQDYNPRKRLIRLDVRDEQTA